MININPTLNHEILTNLGFNFEGTQWSNPKYGFKLLLSNQPGVYLVSVGEVHDLQQKVEPIKDYSQLIKVILVFLNPHIGKEIKKYAPFTSQQEELSCVAKIANDYLSFDKNLKMRLVAGPMGGGLQPANEYSYSLLNGNICKFKALYFKEGITDPAGEKVDFEISPECVSNDYVTKHIIPEGSMLMTVWIDDEKEGLKPFYGAGLKFE